MGIPSLTHVTGACTRTFLICSAEDLFRLSSNKFRTVHKIDGNPQLDSPDLEHVLEHP